jgi:hypothetical protein
LENFIYFMRNLWCATFYQVKFSVISYIIFISEAASAILQSASRCDYNIIYEACAACAQIKEYIKLRIAFYIYRSINAFMFSFILFSLKLLMCDRNKAALYNACNNIARCRISASNPGFGAGGESWRRAPEQRERPSRTSSFCFLGPRASPWVNIQSLYY